MGNKKIGSAVTRLLAVVQQLQQAYPKKKFTLDGRLVGDIGEVLVAEYFDIDLFDTIQRHHDGVSPSGRRVQIKATMKSAVTFPANHIPDYVIGIRIHEDGSFETHYNGPGRLIAARFRRRKKPGNNLHSVSLKVLDELDARVRPEDRIPLRRLRRRRRR